MEPGKLARATYQYVEFCHSQNHWESVKGTMIVAGSWAISCCNRWQPLAINWVTGSWNGVSTLEGEWDRCSLSKVPASCQSTQVGICCMGKIKIKMAIEGPNIGSWEDWIASSINVKASHTCGVSCGEEVGEGSPQRTSREDNAPVVNFRVWSNLWMSPSNFENHLELTRCPFIF